MMCHSKAHIFALIIMNVRENYLFLMILVLSHNNNGASPQIVSKPKIVGGAPAKQFEFPFMVSLQHDTTHVCGGNIVSMKFGVTAAHCFHDFGQLKLTALAGVNDLWREGQRRKIERVVEHEDFSRKTFKNDIAVFYVNPVFLHTNSVIPVMLRDNAVWAGEACKTAGWGITKYGEKIPSDVLLTVDVTIIEQQKCSMSYNVVKPVSMICAFNQGKDACQGDSGGPLMCHGQLTGLVSHGKGCASDFPGVYTNVYHFRDWICRGTGSCLASLQLINTLFFVLLSRSYSCTLP